MDKEQAKFILRSFRPDGADVDDHDFAEALALAVRDRELGEWLADERAMDAAFASALAAVRIPETLREDIIGCLAGERGDFPQAGDERDASMIGALASIQPPADLRGRILTAMTSSSTTVAFPRRSLWRPLALPLAAAAGVAFAFILTRKDETPSAIANNSPLPVDVVQAGFIRAYESPFFRLQKKGEHHAELVQHLSSRKLPCPGCLPPGLVGVKSIGCRELIIDGKRGSLICFEERENGVVHLAIFRRQDVIGDLPQRDHPEFAQRGEWAAARWSDDNNVFILIAATDQRKLANLF
jgi:hypothetical protein